MGCLWGQPYWRAPPDTPPDLFRWVRCEGEANQGHWIPQSYCTWWLPHQRRVVAHSTPWLRWGLPWSGPGSAPAHQHRGRGMAAFRGLHDIPGGGHLLIHQQGSGTALGGQDQLVLIKINHKRGRPLKTCLIPNTR